MKTIICFGEVLWDVLPSGKKLGGAPLNVSLRAQSLGNRSAMRSSLGRDDLGDELASAIVAHGGSMDHIQVTGEYATSEVVVSLDDSGTASYVIKQPCAWDAIKLLERDIKAVKGSDAFIYGSLVARNNTSRETLFALLDHAAYKVFDVNLRPPHYSHELIIRLMQAADFVKFNDDELYEICACLGKENSALEDCITFLARRTDTARLCVTRGKDGAVLFSDGRFYYNKGYRVKVADTVGAGDSFLAAIISRLLEGRHPQEAIDFACALGSIVASRNGANPVVSEAEILKMMEQG